MKFSFKFKLKVFTTSQRSGKVLMKIYLIIKLSCLELMSLMGRLFKDKKLIKKFNLKKKPF